MTQTLYNLRTSDLGYRITKFTDGEVESSYLTSHEECTCPAGHRHTCRHREMIGIMLADGICDTEWFWDHGRGIVVNLMGTPRPACVPAEQDTERRTFTIPDGHMAERDADGRATGKVVPAGQHTAAEGEAYGTGPLMQAVPLLHEWNALPEEERARASSRHVEERMGYEPTQTVRTSPAWRRL